jgi:protein TonB
MFEDSLMESGGKIRTKQKMTTAISTVVQLCLVGVMILLPYIFTEVLPRAQLTTFLVAPAPPPPPPPPAPPVHVVKPRVSEIVNGELRTPSKIPKKIEHITEDEAPPPATSGVIGGVVGGVPGGTTGGVIGGLVNSTAPPPAVAKPVGPRKVSSGVMEGNLVRRIEPTYPNMAKVAHIQGDVVLQATISKQGTIENLRSLNGHPILVAAAMDAVKQWRYRPYELNGEPVEVETTVTVRFHM